MTHSKNDIALGLVVAIFAVISTVIYKIWVAVTLWNLYAQHSAMTPVSMSSMIGIMLVVGLFSSRSLKQFKSDMEYKDGEELVSELLFQIAVTTLVLFIGNMIDFLFL